MTSKALYHRDLEGRPPCDSAEEACDAGAVPSARDVLGVLALDLNTLKWGTSSDRKHQSASNEHGHQVGHPVMSHGAWRMVGHMYGACGRRNRIKMVQIMSK